MASRDSALRAVVLPLHRGRAGGDRRLVRDPLHRPLPDRAVPLRRGRDPLAQPRHRLRADSRDRSISTVPPGSLSSAGGALSDRGGFATKPLISDVIAVLSPRATGAWPCCTPLPPLRQAR